MKKFFKLLGVLILIILLGIVIIFISYNEPLPEGVKGKNAEELAAKMAKALHLEAYKNTEILEWSFRNKNHYKWYKQEGKVEVTLGEDKILLNLNDTSLSKAASPELIQEAIKNFNNDSFWLVAPYKIYDKGVERKLVKHNGKDALLVTYSSGGSTPGDSYLWVLNDQYLPISYKMWVSIIPIGGISASWENRTTAKSGIFLPTKHKLSLLGMEIDMGKVKAYNPKADALANKVLKAIDHEAYKKTRFLEWSFGGRRHFKWDKENHIVEVKWNDVEVILHPNNLEKSVSFLKGKKVNDSTLVKRAWDIFNNDSFWLVAPHKLFDPGTLRNIEQIDNKPALRVKYTTGGSTPGDAYIWILDSLYIPKKYLMYVPSMRMEGTSATWEEWTKTASGTLLPKKHTFNGNRVLSMGNVKGYNK